MGWKKLTVVVVAAAAMISGTIALSMELTKQKELEMEVAEEPQVPIETPQAGDTTTLENMENMPIYYDDDKVLLLPVRNVVEGLGGSVKWDTEKKATEISFHGKKLLLYRGTQQAQLNGYDITLDREPETINTCLYVSENVLSDYFATEVIWDSTQRLVTIKTGDNTKPVMAARHMEGKDGERIYTAEIPVIVGLNDISYEKSLNDDLQKFALEQLQSFPDTLPKEENKPEQETQTENTEQTEEQAAQTENTEQPQTENTPEQKEQTEQKEEIPKPNHVRIQFQKGYFGKKFLSLFWDVEVDGVLMAKGMNVNLQEQKYVQMQELLNTEQWQEKLNVYAEDAAKQNYYISEKEEWVLLPNDKENGSYQQVPVPKEIAQSVYKDKYLFLIS